MEVKVRKKSWIMFENPMDTWPKLGVFTKPILWFYWNIYFEIRYFKQLRGKGQKLTLLCEVKDWKDVVGSEGTN